MSTITKSSDTILVIDEDRAVRRLIHRFLSFHQYQVEAVETEQTALSLVNQSHPALVILDINLLDTNGLELLQKIRWYVDSMILVLTRSTNQLDKVSSYAMGADDFLSKPFDLDELMLRVKALLRRGQTGYPRFQKPLIFDNLIIDPVRCEVLQSGIRIQLTALEFRLLHFMAQQPGRVWTRAELTEGVWGYKYAESGRVIDVHIGQMRRKLEENIGAPKLIYTVRGIGYRFDGTTPFSSSGAD